MKILLDTAAEKEELINVKDQYAKQLEGNVYFSQMIIFLLRQGIVFQMSLYSNKIYSTPQRIIRNTLTV